jgi:hypothetical protein
MKIRARGRRWRQRRDGGGDGGCDVAGGWKPEGIGGASERRDGRRQRDGGGDGRALERGEARRSSPEDGAEEGPLVVGAQGNGSGGRTPVRQNRGARRCPYAFFRGMVLAAEHPLGRTAGRAVALARFLGRREKARQASGRDTDDAPLPLLSSPCVRASS